MPSLGGGVNDNDNDYGGGGAQNKSEGQTLTAPTQELRDFHGLVVHFIQYQDVQRGLSVG